jgi:hypothetical protein
MGCLLKDTPAGPLYVPGEPSPSTSRPRVALTYHSPPPSEPLTAMTGPLHAGCAGSSSHRKAKAKTCPGGRLPTLELLPKEHGVTGTGSNRMPLPGMASLPDNTTHTHGQVRSEPPSPPQAGEVGPSGPLVKTNPVIGPSRSGEAPMKIPHTGPSLSGERQEGSRRSHQPRKQKSLPQQGTSLAGDSLPGDDRRREPIIQLVTGHRSGDRHGPTPLVTRDRLSAPPQVECGPSQASHPPFPPSEGIWPSQVVIPTPSGSGAPLSPLHVEACSPTSVYPTPLPQAEAGSSMIVSHSPPQVGVPPPPPSEGAWPSQVVSHGPLPQAGDQYWPS